MSILGRIADFLGVSGRRRSENPAAAMLSRLRAKYDAAQTTTENQRHWAAADSASANASNNPAVRQTLRNRARYEYHNNGYLKGLIDTKAHDLVGTGARLQLTFDGPAPKGASRQIERLHKKWALAIDLADKLRVLSVSQDRDGEGFGILSNNPALDPFGVQLDLRCFEAEYVCNPLFFPVADDTDGIDFDSYGNPLRYHFLQYHPGSLSGLGLPSATRPIPADSVVHWFRPDRAGQARGVPLIAAALPLFALLRRYTLATVSAAELAACLAGVMKSSMPAGDGDPIEVEAMDTFEIVRNMLLTLPEGWDAIQFKPEQPVDTYDKFKREILNEVGRGVNAPLNVVTGNSSGYNYSSGRLDHLIYHRFLRVERHRMRVRVLDPVFRAWLREAFMIPGYLPADLPPISQWRWEWYWDGFASIDPNKDAQTDERNLNNHITTLSEIYAEHGQDWEEALRQRQRELQLMEELGIPLSKATPAADSPEPNGDEEDEEETGSQEEETASATN